MNRNSAPISNLILFPLRCNKTICILLFAMMPAMLWAGEFAATVRYVNVQKTDTDYILNARFDYGLSPTAKEAIQKGVPLSWILLIKVQQQGRFWDKILYEAEIPFVIQYHALLNQYSVTNKISKDVETFATLVLAMNFMEMVRDLKLVESSVIQPDECYFVALKIQFDREFLPVPLRPESYFDLQWSLSSDWFIWQLQK
jgi:hypothetical protein